MEGNKCCRICWEVFAWDALFLQMMDAFVLFMDDVIVMMVQVLVGVGCTLLSWLMEQCWWLQGC